MADWSGGDIVLGIDLATATARCVAVDTRTGHVLAALSSALPEPTRAAGGNSTQESSYAATALGLVARVVQSLAPPTARIRALSVSGTSGTVVPVDAVGQPVGPALLYDDTSGAALAAARGLPAGSMLGRMAAALLAARDAGMEVARLASTVDVVHAALVAGAVPGDTSHFLKAGIDPVTGGWPAAVRDLGLADVAPPLVAPGTVLGTVDLPWARRLGLGPDVSVVAGMTDGCTGQVATGAIHLGDSVGVLGTTLVLKAVAAAPVSSPDGAVYSHRAPDGAWWPGGASNVGGGALAARTPRQRHRHRHRRLAALDERAAERGPASVVCYPLPRPGERFPVADPHLEPRWSGEPADEVDAHRALLEGVAFVERLGLETLAGLGAPSGRHVLAGGASRSPTWRAVRATVLGGGQVREVRAAGGGGSALGAAVLAAAGTSGEPFGDVVDAMVPPTTAVLPVPAEVERLEASYATFLALVTAATGTHPDRPEPQPRAAVAPTEGTAAHG